MGYAVGRGDRPFAARGGGRAPGASVRPQDRCTIVTTSAPRSPVLHEVEGARRDELSAAVASLPAVGHARRMAGGARGSGRSRALVHVSDPAAHDPDRSAQGRLGAERHRDRRRWSEEGLRVRIVDVGDEETANVCAPGARPARSHDPRRRTRAAGRR